VSDQRPATLQVDPGEWELIGTIWSPHACRRLAARVIEQALKDALRPSGSLTDRESARTFLAGSRMLHYWCELAGFDPGRVTNRARRLLTTSADSSVLSLLGTPRGAGSARHRPVAVAPHPR